MEEKNNQRTLKISGRTNYIVKKKQHKMKQNMAHPCGVFEVQV